MILACAGCGSKSGSFSSTQDQAAAQQRLVLKAEKQRQERANENKQLKDYNSPSKQSAPDQTPGN